MQISDMKALRLIRLQSLNTTLTKHNPTSHTPLTFYGTPETVRFSLISRSTFVRFIHSVNHRQSSFPEASVVDADLQNNGDSSISLSNNEPSSNQSRRVWSIYGNTTGSYPRGSESSNDEEDEVESRGISLDSRQGIGIGDVVLSKNKGKSKVQWLCSSCGNSTAQWWGKCPACDAIGTVSRYSVSGNIDSGVNGFEVSENVVRPWLPEQAVKARPLRLKDVKRGMNQSEWRIPLSGLFGMEVARVLGGGVVPGSLILVGGDPGVGKSTLLLQIAAIIAEGGVGGPAPVLYISGEESVEQIGNRADRMVIDTEDLFLYSSTDIEDIFEKIQHLSPRALVVDSIQTVYLKGVTGGPGGVTQVKECTSALLRFAKKTNIPVLLIGHVNKSGELAGPRILEHIVDVVLYMEASS
ncbi:hypothetical protein Dimus_027652 [Dionaea muscipula]